MSGLINSRDQALKFFIQCNHPLVIERGKGLATFWDVSDTKGKQYTSDELDLYDEAINSTFPGNRGLESTAICKMRADAVKTNSTDEQLGLSCLRGCLARGNLEYAQQVSRAVAVFFCNCIYLRLLSGTFSLHTIMTAHKLLTCGQVAISLEKNFPSNHRYQFFNITITYLYAVRFHSRFPMNIVIELNTEISNMPS